MIVEYIVIGFLSAIGWWSANHYMIEPYFPPPIEKKEEKFKQALKLRNEMKEMLRKRGQLFKINDRNTNLAANARR